MKMPDITIIINKNKLIIFSSARFMSVVSITDRLTTTLHQNVNFKINMEFFFCVLVRFFQVFCLWNNFFLRSFHFFLLLLHTPLLSNKHMEIKNIYIKQRENRELKLFRKFVNKSVRGKEWVRTRGSSGLAVTF